MRVTCHEQKLEHLVVFPKIHSKRGAPRTVVFPVSLEQQQHCLRTCLRCKFSGSTQTYTIRHSGSRPSNLCYNKFLRGFLDTLTACGDHCLEITGLRNRNRSEDSYQQVDRLLCDQVCRSIFLLTARCWQNKDIS